MTTLTDLGLSAGTWNIDPAHSEVAFVIRHLMTKVRGSFTDFAGTLEIADNVVDSKATAEIQIKSIDTRNADRDAHIRSAEILDLDNHPVMTFTSTGVRPIWPVTKSCGFASCDASPRNIQVFSKMCRCSRSNSFASE